MTSTYIPINSQESPLGKHAAKTARVGTTLPFNDDRHYLAHQWMVDEAYTLDQQDYEAWLDLLTEDIHYYMPIKVTTALGRRLRHGSRHGALR